MPPLVPIEILGLGALVFGVGTGLVLGMPIGAAIGSKDKYLFTTPADSSEVLVRLIPPGTDQDVTKIRS
jgi:hypothetical protein